LVIEVFFFYIFAKNNLNKNQCDDEDKKEFDVAADSGTCSLEL
jgi:hypothetical protein